MVRSLSGATPSETRRSSRTLARRAELQKHRASDRNSAIDGSVLASSVCWCSPIGRGSRLKIGQVGVRIPPPAPISNLRLSAWFISRDGCISRMPRTYVLRIFLNERQPHVIGETARAISQLVPMRRVGLSRIGRCVIVRTYWGGWPSMLPQHGPGRKHLRRIALEPWQEKLVAAFPEQFVRGCIHSDGCRHRRIVSGKNYPAYSFSNRSSDILGLFAWTCRLLGIRCSRSSQVEISIARRPDVARLDMIMARSWSDQTAGPTTLT